MALKSCHCTALCKHWCDFVDKYRLAKALGLPGPHCFEVNQLEFLADRWGIGHNTYCCIYIVCDP
jgi:hypothetical protein